MKLTTAKTNTKVGGAQDAPRTFGIAANARSFATLSSGLYNDKIRAIVRELSCNAWDSHVMAGKKTTPFEIHLPTDFEPVFRITDHGVGLKFVEKGCKPCEGTGQVAIVIEDKVMPSPCPKCNGSGNLDEVMSLYCTYFESNKTESNETVGALGLGSKSPFCYTQSQDDPQGFTVVNRYNGVKRIYSAFVDNGAPRVVCLSDEPTDEDNGLEVEFAVNTEDVWEFENKAKMALEFFEPQPTVNVEGFEANREDYAIKTELWALRKEESSVHGLRAIQGMVQYQVGTIDTSRMNREQERASQLPLDLFFPIGELSITASRESLSNDQRTVANILNMLSKVYDGMVEETKKTLNACEFAWQARLKLMTIMESALKPLIEDAYNEGKFHGKYDKFTLTDNKPSLNELDYKTTQVTEFSRTGKKKAEKTVLFKTYNDSDRQLAFDGIKQDVKMTKNFLREIEVGQEVIFIFNDLGVKGTDKYIHAYVQGCDDKGRQYCKTAYVFSVASDKTQMKRMKKEFKKAMELIGNPPYITASFLKENFQHLVDAMKPVPRPRVSGILKLTGSGNSYRGGRNSGWTKNTWSKMPYSDLPTGHKFYIPVEKKKLSDACIAKFYDASDFVTFINNAKSSKLFPQLTAATPVFGLTEKAVAKLAGDANWTNVLTYITDNAQTAIPDSKVLELSIYLEPFDCDHSDVIQAMMRDEAAYAGSPLIEFGKSYFAVKGKKKEAEADAISFLIGKLTEMGKYKRGEVVNFKSTWKKIVQDNYPMLGFGFSRYSANNYGVSYEKSVLQYIRLMDAQKKVEAI